jgi:hypothetical protein
MALRDRSFERSMHQRLRAAIRSSPALRQEEKRTRQRQRTDISQGILRGFATLMLCLSLAKLSANGATSGALLGVITLWAATFAVHYANRLRFQLYGNPQLLVLGLQPIQDEAIFAHQWRGFIQISLWLLLDMTAALLTVFWLAQASYAVWVVALPCAFALWMSAISLAGLFVRFRPGAHYAGLSTGLFLLVVSLVIAGFYLAAPVARVLNGASGALFMVPPFGWINYVVQESVLGPARLPLLLLLPIALLAPAWHHARKVLASHYQFFVADEPESSDENEGESPPILPGATASGAGPTDSDPEQVQLVADLWSRPSSPWPHAGFLERLVGRWLTSRERDLAEFLTAGHADWTVSLRRASVLLMAAVLAASALGPPGIWLCYLGAYFAVSTAIPIFGTACVGLSVEQYTGTSFPAYAGLPIGFHETGRILLKIGVLRTLAFAPVALLAGAAVGHLAGPGWVTGLWLTARIVALLVLLQPIAVLLQFSAGTNDTRSSARRSLKLLFTLGPILLALMGSCLAVLLGPVLWSLAGLPLAFLFSWCAYLLYGRLYNRNAFDLMHGLPQ